VVWKPTKIVAQQAIGTGLSLLKMSRTRRISNIQPHDQACWDSIEPCSRGFDTSSDGFSVHSSQKDLVLENLALREQLLALHAKRPRRRLSLRHRLFWVALRRLWSGWQEPLVLVTPRTIIAWHQTGFRLYWKWHSRTQRTGGRHPTGREIRELIHRMASENPSWGAQRIHGELRMLGFEVSEPTVSRLLRKMQEPGPGKALAGIPEKPS
jgi:hypothetical protein